VKPQPDAYGKMNEMIRESLQLERKRPFMRIILMDLEKIILRA
jgi:hypothetical protein